MTICITDAPAPASLKSVLLATAAALGATLVPAAAQAQAQAAAPATEPADTIIVTGFRKSLEVARNIKKLSIIEKDVIVAEDMAKFPELNLAESLQRLPGVQINREAGEGRRISLRGLGPDFARVQLNGMEVLGNVDSAQDSRGQRSRDRAFDFNIFASELFTRVEVEKTFEAAQNEGGMAGTVGLFTGKPFDYGTGLHAAATAKAGTNQYTKDLQARLAGLVSYNWDNRFGITVSAAWSRRHTTEQGHNTYNYTQVSAGDAAGLVAGGLDISHLTAEQKAKFLGGGLYFADGNRISSWNALAERLGLTLAMQWRPADNLSLTLDALHGQFTTHRDELHLATRPINGAGSTTLDTVAGGHWPANFQSPTVLTDLRWDANNYVTYTNATNVTMGSEHRRELNKNNFNQIALTGKWDASDKLQVDGHIGYEKSTYKTPYDDKFYIRARGNLIADYGTDGRSANFSYNGWNPTDASTYAMDDFYYRQFDNGSELREGTLNLHYKFSPAVTLRVGAAYHRFEQHGGNFFYDGGDNGTKVFRGDTVVGITDTFSNSFGSWLIGDYPAGFARYKEYHRQGPNPTNGLGGRLVDIEQIYTTSESTWAGYAQLDWHTELFGKPLRGNLGLRGYDTKTRSQGWIQGASYAYLGTADVHGHYSGVLPALNTVLDLSPETLIRFAATKNLNRPSLDAIKALGTASLSPDVACDFSKPASRTNCYISVSRGNPNLKPFTDYTLDFAVEHYFGKVGLISAGVFRKWVTNFVDTQNLHGIPFSQTGVPSSTITGASDSTLVTDFSTPYNIPGTKTITGVELAVQSQLSFLPAPFNNFGVLANYTYVDVPPDLNGFSKSSVNATLYYETSRFGARIAASHRSVWYTGRSSDPMSADTRGFEGSTYVDASAFVNVIKGLQITFNAINLTNQKDTQFWGQARYLYNQNQSGTTYMAGVSYKF